MVESNVLFKYEPNKIFDENRSNKIADVRLVLYPHPNFISEVISAKNKKKPGNLTKYPLSRKINVESELHILAFSSTNTGIMIEK